MKRKSPIRHKVSSHTRDGKKVKSYKRGSGTKPTKKLSKPTIKKPKGYTVKLRYSKRPHDMETVKVIATSYMRALDEALEERFDKRKPIEVHLIDPSIGEVLSWAGSRALKYGKTVAEYGKTATKTVAKGAYESAKRSVASSVDDWRAQRLIEDAYSDNKGKKILARAKLKRNYPHVWDIMGISKS